MISQILNDRSPRDKICLKNLLFHIIEWISEDPEEICPEFRR